eukprot:155150_1
MKAISLVSNNEKMIYMPQNDEELAEINAIIFADKDEYKGINDTDDEYVGDEPAFIESGGGYANSMYDSDKSKDLEKQLKIEEKEKKMKKMKQMEKMTFGGRILYKDTKLCKRLEKQYLECKNEKGLLSVEDKQTNTSKPTKATTQMESAIENAEKITELSPLKRDGLNAIDLSKAHPIDICCEG